MAGRPSKLTDDLERRICNLLMQGVMRPVACVACGINLGTFYRWLEWGTTRRLEGQGERPGTAKVIKARPRYRQFREQIERAEAMSEALLVQTVRKGAYETTTGANGELIVTVKDWRAAAWMLERKNPAVYAQAAVEREAEEMPSDASAPAKLPVVFGGRFMPNGELKVPLLPAPVHAQPPEEPHHESSTGTSHESAAAHGERPTRSGTAVPDV